MTNIYLPIDYNDREYAPIELLLQGDVDIWLRRRDALLKEKSRHTGFEAEASKLLSAGVGIGALLASANPLAWLPMAIAAGGYVYTVFREYQDTGSIRPLPLFRGNLGDVLVMLEGRTVEGRHPLLNEIEYLTEAEKDEALLLNYRFGELAGLLKSAPERTRFDLYRHICNQFFARKDLIGADEVKLYLANAVSPTRLQPLSQAPKEVEDANPFPAFQPQDTPSPVVQIPTTPNPSPAATVPAIVYPQPAPISEEIDIVQAIIENMFSFAVIGAPGSGKGFVGSHVWRAAQSQLGLKVFAIEPKNDLKERGYWETCEYVYRGTPTDPDATFGELPADTKTAWILGAIATYRQWVRSIDRAPHILVFDEATVLLGHATTDKKLFAEIRGLLSHLTSSGNSMGHYIFLLGHIPNLSVYGLSGGEMACLKNVYLYSQKQTDLKNLLAAGNTTYFGSKFGSEKLTEIQAIADRSECHRAFYFGQTNQWYPMKKLPNLCGYDRDSKTFLNDRTAQGKTTDWNQEIAILNQRSKAIAVEIPEVETNPIADWDNGYQVTDDALLEVLEFIRGKYGTNPINPSEVHRSQTSIRKLYDGKVDNLKALLFRAVREELAILDSDDKGSPVIRLL